MDSNPSRIAESGVFVGRDVIKSIIVTGNHNQFFIGGYARLRDAYIYPSTVFDDLDRDGFAGRGWLKLEARAVLLQDVERLKRRAR